MKSSHMQGSHAKIISLIDAVVVLLHF